MADHTTGLGSFTVGETVNAYLNGNEGVAAAASVTAGSGVDAGKAAFVGLQPKKLYTLVGATSGKRLTITTDDEVLGGGRASDPRVVSVVFDAADPGAFTGAPQNISTPPGTVDVGDTVVFVGRSGTTGPMSIDVGPIVTADTLPVMFGNAGAAGVNLPSQTYRFLVFKKRQNI